MSVEIAWKQNILVTDFHLLKSLLVVLGFGSQVFVCGFSRQNINSVEHFLYLVKRCLNLDFQIHVFYQFGVKIFIQFCTAKFDYPQPS